MCVAYRLCILLLLARLFSASCSRSTDVVFSAMSTMGICFEVCYFPQDSAYSFEGSYFVDGERLHLATPPPAAMVMSDRTTWSCDPAALTVDYLYSWAYFRPGLDRSLVQREETQSKDILKRKKSGKSMPVTFDLGFPRRLPPKRSSKAHRTSK